MISKRVFSSSIVLSALLTLSACGGGSTTIDLQATATDFSAKVSSSLSALTSSAGLKSQALLDLFDEKFLDGGYTKAALVDLLGINSTTLGTNPELSLFPMATVSNAKVTCGDTNICTLTGTLTNSDADTTSVDFSTKVLVNTRGVFFYGDQSSTTTL
jgi:hypothetical protein